MKVKWNEINLQRMFNVIKLAGKLLFNALFLTLRLFLDFTTDLLFGLVNWNSPEQLPPIKDLVLLEPASSIAAKIRNRKLKSKDVVESFIARIKEVNPILNAVVEENFEQALEEAIKVDKFIASGSKNEKEIEKDTPLLGVPYTTKDSVKVKGLKTTAGLVSRKNVPVSDEDAEVIKLMRKAGAILLAHTNISELCMWWESYNYVYGRTNNPYNTNRIVGGSSGGEGSILAAAGSVIGIGSDIGGSIRMPCFFNGVFGHKPTSGIVNNKGQMPVAHGILDTFLTTGPMCRYATDLSLVFKILATPNLHKLKLDTPVNVSSLRYFYMESDGGFSLVSKVHPSIQTAMRKVTYYLEQAYKLKPTKAELHKFKFSLLIWSYKMSSANAPAFCEELAELKGKINAPWEMIKWLVWCSNHTLPALMLGLTESFTSHEGETSTSYINMCTDLTREIEEMLGDDGIFFYPTHPRPAPYHYQPVFMPFNFSYTAIFNVLGFPSTHVPLGLNDDGLPVGIQVVANKNNDHLCLAVACELERAFGGWVSPSMTTF